MAKLVYQDNVRKGNAVLICKGPTGEVVKAYFAKRGLKKTKALTYEEIQNGVIEKGATAEEGPGLGLNAKCLQKIEEHLSGGFGCTVDLIKETKSNGVKVMVSYDDFTCCWIIGTDKETIAVYKNSDIDLYTHDSLYDVKQAAYCFLDILRDFTSKELTQLKEDLIGFTLVGEYIGDYTIQHVVRYNKTAIVFNAMVPNDKNLQCYPPESYINLMKKHGLPHSSYEICRNIKTSEDVMDALCDLANHIEQSTLHQSEEGAIIFLVLQRESEQKVLLTSKIKTLEYRIYKRLRDRVFEHIDMSNDPTVQYDALNEEIYDIIKNADLHHSTNYYLNIADTAFRFCYEYPDFHNFVRDNFVSFLSLIIHSLHENYRLTPVVIKDKKKLKMIESKNWYSYSMGTMNLRNLDTKRTQKPKKKEKETEMYVKKSPKPSNAGKSDSSRSPIKSIVTESSRSPVKSMADGSELYRKKSLQKPVEDKVEPVKEVQKIDLSDTNTAILLPVCLPGYGGTRFITSLCTALDSAPIDVRTSVLDADLIRNRVLDELKGEKNRLGIEEYINVSNDKCKEKLESETIDCMTQLKVHKNGLNIVVIKKHFNCTQAQELITNIKARITGEGVKFFCVTSSSARTEENLSLNVKGKQISLPFNRYMLMTCLKRKLDAKVLTGNSQRDDFLFIEQVMSQCSKFAGQTLSAATMKEKGFDGFIGFPFTNIQNEENFVKTGNYKKTSIVLDDIVTSFLSKVEPTVESFRELKVEVENFKIGAEWWQLNDSEGKHTEYHHFILRAIGSLLKKYKSLSETLIANSPSNKTKTVTPGPIKTSTATVIPITMEQSDIEKNMEIEHSIEKLLSPIRNKNSVGKRRKPTEIGIYSKLNKDMIQNLFKNLIIDVLEIIEPFVPQTAEDKTLIASQQKWQFAQDFHITVLYIGGKTLTKDQDVIYNAFEADHEFPFLVHGLIYVPGVAVIGVTKLNRELILIEDKYDHLMIMSTKPTDRSLGSTIVEQAFANDEMRDHWQARLNKMTHVVTCQIKIDGDTKTAYLLPFKKKVLVQAATGVK